MRALRAAALALAFALVFSPLASALGGTGLDATSLAAAFHGLSRPLGGSVATALTAALVALLLGTPFALLVERARPRLRRALWVLGLLVLMVPPYIAAEAWIVLLGPAGKISRPLATLLGFGPATEDPITLARFEVPGLVYTWPSVGVVMGACLFPLVALAVASAYRRTDHRVFEAARIAQGPRGVREIAARLLLPPALGGALLVFAATLTEFAVPQLLRVRTVGEAVYERIQEGELATAAALGLPLLPLVVGAGALGALVIARARLASLAGLEGEVPRFEGRRASLPGELAAVLVTLVAIGPGLISPATSLTWLAATAHLAAQPYAGVHSVVRASGFLDSLQGAWDLARDDALRTVLLATIAATLATVLATALARLLQRTRLATALGALGAGLAVPAPVVALGLIVLWNRPHLVSVYQSVAIVLLAWLARFFAIAVFLAQGALARVPRELESAAALAGRGPAGRLLAVVLPNAAPGLAAAWLAVYVLSATEFSATLLIAPPGKPLLAPSIVNLMRRGQDPEIAACQLLLLAVVALPLVPIALGALVRSARSARKT
jgi:iron(III) transport system permease protein